MSRHKHRRRDEMDGFGSAQGINNGYMNQQGNPMMNQMGAQGVNPMQGQMNNPMQGQMNNGMGGGMNPNMQQPNMNPMMGGQQPNMGMNNPMGNMFGGGGMNNIMQLLSSLGLADPSQMAGLSQILGGNGVGAGNGGQAPDIFSMINSLLNMGGVQGNQGQAQTVNNSEAASASTIEELLAKIKPEDIAELQRVLNNMQQNQEGQQQAQPQTPPEEVKVDDILSNLDFNSILDNLNNSELDLSGTDVDNLDVSEENIKTVNEEDIIEENVVKTERELTVDEYKKLVNVLVRLIDPNKIRLLQKIVDDYNKDKKE